MNFDQTKRVVATQINKMLILNFEGKTYQGKTLKDLDKNMKEKGLYIIDQINNIFYILQSKHRNEYCPKCGSRNYDDNNDGKCKRCGLNS